MAARSVKTLRDLRLEAGLTQARLAEIIGTHMTCIQRWETGARAIPAVHLERLAQELHVTEDDLCNAWFDDAKPGRSAHLKTVRMPEHVDPADCLAWKRRDDDARDATRRYREWAEHEEQLQQEAQRVRDSAGRPRYAPTYGEPLFGGPSPVPGRPRQSA